MRELSEKELEKEYKDLKMTDIPDMWDDIERNLAPKKKKRVVPIRRIASMAAVVAAVAVLVPVMYVIQQGGKKNASMDSAVNENASMSESADMNGSAGMEESFQESSDVYNKMENILQLEIRVQNVEKTEGGLLILATVTDHPDSNDSDEAGQSSGYQPGDEIRILYEYEENESGESDKKEDPESGDMGYAEEDFSGILKVLCEKTEENLKLLEILP